MDVSVQYKGLKSDCQHIQECELSTDRMVYSEFW